MVEVVISPSFSPTGVAHIQSKLAEFKVIAKDHWEENDSAQALILRSKDKLTSKFLKLYPKVEFVVSATSGFDHIDLELANRVSLAYSPEANAQSAAELSLFHILGLLRKSKFSQDPKAWREQHMMGEELQNKKVSLIGLGRIGKKVAKMLRAFGAEVGAHDPYIEDHEFSEYEVKRLGLIEALRWGDVISLHCPLTKKTRGLINETTLTEMSSSSLLINCARGELVDSDALARRLLEQELAGAALDVFEHEPLQRDSHLRSIKNLHWTPHIGAFTLQAQINSALEAAQQVESWFQGDKDAITNIPPKMAWTRDL